MGLRDAGERAEVAALEDLAALRPCHIARMMATTGLTVQMERRVQEALLAVLDLMVMSWLAQLQKSSLTTFGKADLKVWGMSRSRVCISQLSN